MILLPEPTSSDGNATALSHSTDIFCGYYFCIYAQPQYYKKFHRKIKTGAIYQRERETAIPSEQKDV